MSRNIIFKSFKTPRGHYIYDRQSHTVFSVSEDDFNELRGVEEGFIDEEESKVIGKYRKRHGMFRPNTIEEIEHPETAILSHNAQTGLNQLILQVTQNCNLRCSYCAFSGMYKDRHHTNKSMPIEIAKCAIDFYFERVKEAAMRSVSFYGGEPLLEFQLIKECVDYCKQKIKDRPLIFSLTTNGTLLEGDILAFLAKEDFHILVSLDGSKKEHDINRKFVNGEGSFDTIMRNIQNTKEKYPEFYERNICFNTVINPNANLSCVQEYFTTSELFSDENIMFNDMKESGIKDEAFIRYDDSFSLIRRFEYLKWLLFMAVKLPRDCISPLMINERETYNRLLNELRKNIPLPQKTHRGGPCVPGIRRLFVDADGAFYPCERVSTDVRKNCIGSLKSGFDYQNMDYLLNCGRLTKDKCLTCWNFRMCLICLGSVNYSNNPDETKDAILKKCDDAKAESVFKLSTLCILKEFGYRLPQEEI